MKYLKIILFSFLIGCAVTLTIAVIMQSQREPRPPRSCDMSALVYPFAVGINLLLAAASLPALFNLRAKVRENAWLSAASFFILPLLAVAYCVIVLDLLALMFCWPYLAALLYFFIRFRYSLRSRQV